MDLNESDSQEIKKKQFYEFNSTIRLIFNLSMCLTNCKAMEVFISFAFKQFIKSKIFLSCHGNTCTAYNFRHKKNHIYEKAVSDVRQTLQPTSALLQGNVALTGTGNEMLLKGKWHLTLNSLPWFQRSVQDAKHQVSDRKSHVIRVNPWLNKSLDQRCEKRLQ